MPSNEPRPNKAQRRDEAREQARKLREQQQQRETRNRIIGISSVVVAVVVAVVVVVVILGRGSGGGTTAAGAAFTGDKDITLADVTAPSTAESNGGIPVGKDGVAGVGAPAGDVVVSVYLDYMCPYCGRFEQANDTELTSLREEGGVTVEYHLLAFLDSQSQGAEYSTRAANAAAMVADKAPEQFVAFSSALFANQPKESTTGLDDDTIASLAVDAGVPQPVVNTFTDAAAGETWRTFAPWLAANNNQASKDLGGVSTPTVLINGEKFTGDLYNAGPLREAVEAAKG
ncbi:DsbA family protein [Cellulomonas hominis]